MEIIANKEEIQEVLSGEITALGNSAHVPMPRKLIGKKVIVVVKEKL